MDSVQMGVTYFELDDTVETHEKLIQFFKDLGFTLVKNKPLGSELCNRVSQFTDNNGLEFDVIWYRNLAHIRFGTWGKSLFECGFDKIAGAWLPFADHITLSLFNGKEKTATLAIAKNEK